MSLIPKPKKVPTPKRLHTTDDLDSAGHQELLDLLWSNLESVVAARTQRRPEWLAAAAQAAQDKFNRQTSEILQDMELFLKAASSSCDSGAVEKVRTAKSKFEKALSDVALQQPPADATLPLLSWKQYQQPITVTKHDRQGQSREESVGYIDIGCSFSLPSGLDIEGCPFHFQTWDIDDHACSNHDGHELSQLTMGQVSWRVNRNETQNFWFDVRATLPNTGVLIQELRVLRELATENTVITLVCEEIPTPVAEVLRHEGFWCLTRSDISRNK